MTWNFVRLVGPSLPFCALVSTSRTLRARIGMMGASSSRDRVRCRCLVWAMVLPFWPVSRVGRPRHWPWWSLWGPAVGRPRPSRMRHAPESRTEHRASRAHAVGRRTDSSGASHSSGTHGPRDVTRSGSPWGLGSPVRGARVAYASAMDDLAGSDATSPDDDEFTVAQDTEFDEDELAPRRRPSGGRRQPRRRGAGIDAERRVDLATPNAPPTTRADPSRGLRGRHHLRRSAATARRPASARAARTTSSSSTPTTTSSTPTRTTRPRRRTWRRRTRCDPSTSRLLAACLVELRELADPLPLSPNSRRTAAAAR